MCQVCLLVFSTLVCDSFIFVWKESTIFRMQREILGVTFNENKKKNNLQLSYIGFCHRMVQQMSLISLLLLAGAEMVKNITSMFQFGSKHVSK